MTRHRWPKQGTIISPHKTERECLNGCGTVKVTRHESEGGRDTHWTEFWCGLEQHSATPPCVRHATSAAYDARSYPL